MLGPKTEIAMSPHLRPKRPRKVATLLRGVAVVAKKPSTTDHISSDAMTQPNYIPNQPTGANIQEIDEEQFEYDYTDEKPVIKKEEKSPTDKYILPIIIFLTTMALNTPIKLKY